MKKTKIMLYILTILSLIMLVSCKSNTGKQCKVKIEDGYVDTIFDVKKDTTVEEAIKEAELSLGKNDVVAPKLTSKITKDTSIQIERYSKVTVNADKKAYKVAIAGGKVSDALKEAKITLSKHDIMNHEKEEYLLDGMNIDITRIVEIKFTADGKSKQYLTKAKTVGEFLKSENVSIGNNDRLSLEKSAKLQDGDVITLKRVEYRKETQNQSIPYSTTTRSNASMKAGTTRVIKSGENGTKKVTYKICYVDGHVESKKEISSKVIKQAQNKIIERGTKKEVMHKAVSKAKPKSKGKTIVKKWKEVECDGTVIWHIQYSDGSTSIRYN